LTVVYVHTKIDETKLVENGGVVSRGDRERNAV